MRRAWLPSLCALALALPASADHQRSQRANRSTQGWPLAPFTLQDHHGAPLTQARLEGRWTFLMLGDSRCARPCTDGLAALAGLRQRIARTQALKTTQVVFVSLDPARETPQRLRAYLAPFDSSFVGGTGSEPALRGLVDDLALAREPGPGAKAVQGALVLIGPDAVTRVEYLPPYDVKLLTADYLRLRARG